MKFNLSNIIDQKQAKLKFEKLCKEGKKIELTEKRYKRTNNQNKYLHALFGVYGAEFGYTTEETKDLFKKYCPFMEYEKKGQLFYRHTSKMDTKELSEFVEWIRNYSAKKGLYLMTAEEYEMNRFDVEKYLESFKEFL